MNSDDEIDILGQLAALKQCVALTLAIANHAAGRTPQSLEDLKNGIVEGMSEVIGDRSPDEARALAALQPPFAKTVEAVFRMAEAMQEPMKQ